MVSLDRFGGAPVPGPVAEREPSERPDPAARDREVQDVLGVGRARRVRRGWLWLIALLVLAGAGVGVWRLVAAREAAPPWDTAEVRRGPLEVTVVAVGALEPSDTVAVGSEQSGLVEEVTVDVNDAVRAGQVLARLDTDLLRDQLAQARAQVAVAHAGVGQADATLAAARRELARIAPLGAGAVAAQTVDQARDAVDQAEAGLALARAQHRSARASVAALRTQLDRAVIRSPVDGVVLARHVEPGQPVISALQAATLFEVAADLQHLELVVDVDEADVGRVHAGQAARFSVPAWPDREWSARVVRLDLAPKPMEQVVSYPATLAVDNADGMLRPGMTATATLVAERLDDALLVPSAALRFAPPDVDAPPDGPTVWTAGPDGPVPHAVRVLGRERSRTALADGAVRAGERVLVERP